MARRELTRRDLLAAAGATGAVALAGCGGKGGSAEASGACEQPTDVEEVVAIHGESADQHFEPGRIEVEVGDTVAWQAAEDTEDHQVKALDTPAGASWVGITTQFLEHCQTYKHTFEVPGTYTYQCSPYHPAAEGTVVVRE